jgi:hypothetical protein
MTAKHRDDGARMAVMVESLFRHARVLGALLRPPLLGKCLGTIGSRIKNMEIKKQMR